MIRDCTLVTSQMERQGRVMLHLAVMTIVLGWLLGRDEFVCCRLISFLAKDACYYTGKHGVRRPRLPAQPTARSLSEYSVLHDVSRCWQTIYSNLAQNP